jgi:competence protein ComGC
MRTFGCKRVLKAQDKLRGSGMIGLLIVVVIIMIVMIFVSPLSKDDQAKVSRAQTYMDRSRDAVCKLNIDSARNRLTELQLANPGMAITPLLLEKKNVLTPCPDHGEYVIKNGQIYCTKHFPPPPDPTPAGAAATTSTVAATAPVQ